MKPLASFSDLRARRTPYVEQPVPVWGATVFIWKLSALERLEVTEAFEACERDEHNRMKHRKDAVDFGVDVLARAVRNADGERLFDTPEGRQFLAAEELDVIQALVDCTLSVNGLSGTGKND